MQYLNPNEIQYCHIDKWHNKGWTGKGVKIAVIGDYYTKEKVWIKDPFKQLIPPFVAHPTYSHADKVISVVHEVAPEAEISFLPLRTDLLANYLGQYQIVEISHSDFYDYLPEFQRTVNEDNTLIVVSAGNKDDPHERMSESNKMPYLLSVGAVHLQNNQIKFADYSLYDQIGDVDCVGFSAIKCGDGNIAYGTSFSAPWVAGMFCLYYQWFKANYERFPIVEEARKFLENNTEDLGDEGLDREHGYGLFILPENIESEERGEDKVKDRILTLEQLLAELDKYSYKELHVHHTYKPDHSDWNKRPDGLYWNQSMRNYHVNNRGWQDIGQHVTLLPNGKFVTGRDFGKTPASIQGYNTGAFAVEMLGNFDIGHDKFDGVQKEAMIGLARYFYNKGCYIRFHRENAPKTCPGSSIDKNQFMQEVENKKEEQIMADEFTRGIQGALNKVGYNLPTDGVPSRETMQAVRELVNRLIVAERKVQQGNNSDERLAKSKELAKKILEV